MAQSESFSSLWQLVIEGLFGWPFFFAWPDQALKRPSWLESFSIIWPIRGLKGQPVWGLSLLFSCWCWYVGERGYSVGFLPCTWLNSITAFMAAWFSYTVISNHDLLLHVPLGHLPAANSRPHPGICSPVPTLQLPAAVLSRGLASLSTVCMIVARLSLWFSFQQDCHWSAASLPNSLKCFSSAPNIFLDVGIWPLLQFPHSPGAGPVLLTLLPPPPPHFFILPSSSWFYIFISGTLSCS